jgi:hypothetical protein
VCGWMRRPKPPGKALRATGFRLTVPTRTGWTTPSTAPLTCGMTTERVFCSFRCVFLPFLRCWSGRRSQRGNPPRVSACFHPAQLHRMYSRQIRVLRIGGPRVAAARPKPKQRDKPLACLTTVYSTHRQRAAAKTGHGTARRSTTWSFTTPHANEAIETCVSIRRPRGLPHRCI